MSKTRTFKKKTVILLTAMFLLTCMSAAIFTYHTEGTDDDRQLSSPGAYVRGDILRVISYHDSGAGSLRDVIENANDGDLITFDPKIDWSANPIVLESEITISKELIIDGGTAGVTITKNGGSFRLMSSAADVELTLNGLTFVNGSTSDNGGAVYAGGSVAASNCIFKENASKWRGGAVYADGNMTLTGCTFMNNKAMTGGAVYAAETAVMTNCTFTNNTAAASGGAYVNNSATLTGCKFIDNTASDSGGLYVYQGTISATGCTFVNNKAVATGISGGSGGGISTMSADIILTGCTFTGNEATNIGGGVNSYSRGEISIIGCTFTGNAAGSRGSAVYSHGNDINVISNIFIEGSGFAYNDSSSGVVYTPEGCVTAKNTTFFANTVDSDSGILESVTAVLTHCTFTKNEGKYNISVALGRITKAENCLMTADGMTANSNTGITGTNDLNGTYAGKFGNNIITFNYVMPLLGTAAGASVISGSETDAAGNTRTGSACLYGAVNWTAVSFVVKNSNDSGIDSLPYCMSKANENDSAASWRVVYFDDTNTLTGTSIFDIKLTTGAMDYNKNIMVYGKLDKNGDPEVTVDAEGRSGIFYHRSLGNVYFYGLNINNASVSGGIHSSGNVTAVSCNFTGNTTSNPVGGSGGGVHALKDIILTDCTFTNNTAEASGGGAFTNSGNATVTNCTFIGNKAKYGAGGLFASVDGAMVIVTGCVFTNNVSANSSAVAASTAGYLFIINSTISGNTTESSDDGAVACPAKTYIFHSTITNNIGGGLYSWTAYTERCLFNSIIAGNVNADGTAPRDIVSKFINVSSLVEGSKIPGSSYDVPVTVRQMFGLNKFDPATNSHPVLSNGIASGTAAAVTAIQSTYLTEKQKQNVMNALRYDQNGVPRGTDVNYGATETLSNWLVYVSVAKDPVKTEYEMNETIVLTGTEIALDYSNGDETVPYDEIGMTNTSSSTDMSTAGIKRIDFTFLGVTTKDDTCLYITVKKVDTVTVVSASGDPVYGGSVTFTATVTSVKTGIPAGEVSFYDDSVFIGKASLDENGVATLTISSLSIDTHKITAEYEGNTNYNGSVSNELEYTVSKIDTVTVVSASGDPVYGGSVTFTATVTSVKTGIPAGEVSFYDDSVFIGEASLDENGIATLTVSSLSIDTHKITAEYEGSTIYNGSVSNELEYTVSKIDTATVIVSVSGDPVYGGSMTFAATVTSAKTGIPAGEVSFYDNSVSIGKASLDENGVTTLTISSLSFGAHKITAEYEGNTTYNGSASNELEYTVSKIDTATVIVFASDEPAYGGSVTFAATVTSAKTGMPAGEVSFYDNLVFIGKASLDENGVATLTVSSLSIDTHKITAEYEGSTIYNRSVSNELEYTVSEGVTDPKDPTGPTDPTDPNGPSTTVTPKTSIPGNILAFLISALLMLLLLLLFGRMRPIVTGIISENGQAIENAVVEYTIDGKGGKVTTDMAGVYVIFVPRGAYLEINKVADDDHRVSKFTVMNERLEGRSLYRYTATKVAEKGPGAEDIMPVYFEVDERRTEVNFKVIRK
ncbi:MAG: Ig-like domain repeat protein [Methanomassiliicoccaceae archaeon]|jgi:hypothetical protein|nr:Ig-like domain repeat protein [Methanomassiliicoccaceae archaeon]